MYCILFSFCANCKTELEHPIHTSITTNNSPWVLHSLVTAFKWLKINTNEEITFNNFEFHLDSTTYIQILYKNKINNENNKPVPIYHFQYNYR